MSSSEGNVITTTEGDYAFVEVSELWTAACSDIACGPWVQFPGYSEAHRYNAHLPGVGPVIIQLWKGFCPRFSPALAQSLANRADIGNEFPGGLGAEVGIYKPMVGSTMEEAATASTALGLGKWEPLERWPRWTWSGGAFGLGGRHGLGPVAML